MGYLLESAIAFDKLANTLLAGSHTETLSARAWRMAKLTTKPKKRWRVIRRSIDWLFFWDANHCLSSYQAGIVRREIYLKKARAQGAL